MSARSTDVFRWPPPPKQQSHLTLPCGGAFLSAFSRNGNGAADGFVMQAQIGTLPPGRAFVHRRASR